MCMCMCVCVCVYIYIGMDGWMDGRMDGWRYTGTHRYACIVHLHLSWVEMHLVCTSLFICGCMNLHMHMWAFYSQAQMEMTLNVLHADLG